MSDPTAGSAALEALAAEKKQPDDTDEPAEPQPDDDKPAGD